MNEPARHPAGFAIRHRECLTILGMADLQSASSGWAKKKLQSCLLRIANPQSLKRLGRFLTTDFKSVGAPSGL